jgi:hypothetical protein
MINILNPKFRDKSRKMERYLNLLTGLFSIFQRKNLDIMILLPARGHVPLSKVITNLSISILLLGLF